MSCIVASLSINFKLTFFDIVQVSTGGEVFSLRVSTGRGRGGRCR